MWWLPCKQAVDAPSAALQPTATVWDGWQRYFQISNSSIQLAIGITGTSQLNWFHLHYLVHNCLYQSAKLLLKPYLKYRQQASCSLHRIASDLDGQTTVSICDQLVITAVSLCWGGLVVHYVLFAGLLPVTEWDTRAAHISSVRTA